MDHKEPRMTTWIIEESDFPPKRKKANAPLWLLFEAIARGNGDIAVAHNGETWSYHKLCEEAETVCHDLREQKFKDKARIGIHMEPSARSISIILGILRAGYSYVPISPSDPFERVIKVVANANISFLYSDDKPMGEKIVSRVEQINGNASDAGVGLTSKEAYVLHTSGTTGIPKGVSQSHENVIKNIDLYSGRLGITKHDRLTLFSALSSDAAMKIIFGAFLNGSSILIYNVSRVGISKIGDWVRSSMPTIWHSTPTLFTAAAERFKAPLAVRWVVFGGESASPKDINFCGYKCGSATKLLVGYSQTECSLIMDKEFDLSSGIPIDGKDIEYKPLPGVKVEIIDELGNQTDNVGEITISSPGLFTGYVQHEDILREVVQAPSSLSNRHPTGDLGKATKNGKFKVVGRLHDHVNIRGNRINLGEIKVALEAHHIVVKAEVLLAIPSNNNEQIVAFVKMNKPFWSGRDELRKYTLSKLPSYMVPSKFVYLDEIPLLANGKIDRKSLLAINMNNG